MGPGWWRRLWSITIPLLRPSFTIIFVLAAGVLGAAEESLIFFPTETGPRNAALLVGRYSYDVAFRLGDMRWGYAITSYWAIKMPSRGMKISIIIE